jgi:tyrosine-protein kinase Etk/Wzc
METTYVEEKVSGGGFDFKRLLIKLAKNWFWILLSVCLFGAGAWFYLQYTVPLYLVNSFIQVQPPRDASTMLGGSPFAEQGGASTPNNPDINSEVFKLQSATLISEVVDSLGLDIEVIAVGQNGKKAMPADSLPFEVSIKKPVTRDDEVNYRVWLNELSYRIESDHGAFDGAYDEPLIIGSDTLLLSLVKPLPEERAYTWEINSLPRSEAVSRYVSRLSVSALPKAGTGMLEVSVRDEIPARAKKFIEVLAYRYDLANFRHRSKSLLSEMQFLDKRLAAVNEELEKQENNVRDFKATNKINDVSSSANELLSNLSSIDSRKNDNAFKENLIRLVEDNIQATNGQEERINVPGLDDVQLTNLVKGYNDLVSEKNNILVQGTENDLRLPTVNAKLEDARDAILNRIRSIRAELKASNEFLASQERDATGRFRVLPEKEKDYIQVNRLLNIKQQLYVFLLQRKEDLNIEYASSGIGGTRFIDWKVNYDVQDPKPSLIYAAAIAIGLLLPSGIIIARFLLNKRLETSSEIYSATRLPVAGEIAFEKKVKEKLPAAQKNGASPVAEQFRTLRTNLSYLNRGTDRKVLLVTSSTSGEGKSFVSLNLAYTIAITEKRTVLLEFDLRNPSLADKLGYDEMPGITNFLEGNASMEEIIHTVNGGYFSLISAGTPLPEHPGELILSSRMQELFDYLREQFDFIIIDTPPIEAVSDALTLARYADSSFFVVRHKYSKRASLNVFNQLHEDGKLPAAALVINGIRHGDGFQNINGYGYGYVKGGRKKPRKRHKLKLA